MTILAVDIGASGSRALLRADADVTVSGPPISRGAGGGGFGAVLSSLAGALPQPRGPLSCIAIGLAGVMTFELPAEVLDQVLSTWPACRVIVASDAAAALVGSWGLSGGAVVAAGTGVTAIGSDMDTQWIRVDGWGHLVGDDGSGAWIGRAGLNAALRAIDGREGGSPVLRDLVISRWGDPHALVRDIQTSNAPQILASFAPSVAEAAAQDDRAAITILEDAGNHLALAASAALGPSIPPRVALIGGVTHLGAVLTDAFRGGVIRARPDAEVVVGGATALSGALRLALERESVITHAPFIYSFAADDCSGEPQLSHDQGES